MATQTAAATGPQQPDQQVTEREARFLPGLRMLAAGIVGLLAGVALVVVASRQSNGTAVVLVVLCVLILLASSLVLAGLTPVVPGQARVVQLFGRYRGTIRDSGLQWVNPFTKRIAVSTRIRNQESAQAKVNDADGNPIEIAAVVVWQVADTASAIYSVDDYTQFVTIQTETAVRHIASSYPYTSRREGELSLRDNAERDHQQALRRDRRAGRIGRGAHHRVAADPAVVCAGDRPGHAAPAAGQRRGRRPADDRGRRGRHGPAGPAAAPGRGASSSWTRSARPRWSPTCWWSCAASRPPSRSSTPAPSTSDGRLRNRGDRAQERPAAAGPRRPRRPGPMGQRRAAQHQRPDRVPAPPRARRRRAAARPRRADAAPRAATRRQPLRNQPATARR